MVEKELDGMREWICDPLATIDPSVLAAVATAYGLGIALAVAVAMADSRT